MYEPYNNYLAHYGVKGMKWGIRHDPVRKGGPRRGRSFKGNLQRLAAKNYSLNERAWRKLGNKSLASMNAQAKNAALKKAASYDAKASKKSSRKISRGAKIAGGVLAVAGGVAVGAILVKSGKASQLASVGKSALKSVKGSMGTKISDISKNPYVHNAISSTRYGVGKAGKVARSAGKSAIGKTRKVADSAYIRGYNTYADARTAAAKAPGAARRTAMTVAGTGRSARNLASEAARSGASNAARKARNAAMTVAGTGRSARNLASEAARSGASRVGSAVSNSRAANSSAARKARNAAMTVAGTGRSARNLASEAARSGASRVGSAAKSGASSVGNAARSGASRVGSTAKSGANRVTSSRAYGSARQTANYTRNRVTNVASQRVDNAKGAYNRVSDSVARTRASARNKADSLRKKKRR